MAEMGNDVKGPVRVAARRRVTILNSLHHCHTQTFVVKVMFMPTAFPQKPYMPPGSGRNTKRLLNIVPIVREDHGISNPRHQHVGISGSIEDAFYVSGFSSLLFWALLALSKTCFLACCAGRSVRVRLRRRRDCLMQLLDTDVRVRPDTPHVRERGQWHLQTFR